MYKCIKCNKEFKYESEFNRHINRKTNCNINNINLECIICKVKLTRAYDKLRHEKTKKHIYNINKNNNKDIEINNETNILNEKINNLENDNNLLKNDNNLLKKEIIKLKNENKSLIESNQLLRNNQKIHIAKEYIYIIHCAQHINENIYKIGRTKNIINRFKQYPNGSELLFTITCNNSKLIENNIIQYLKNNINYIHYKESGNEYFKCNLENLKIDIQNIINTNL